MQFDEAKKKKKRGAEGDKYVMHFQTEHILKKIQQQVLLYDGRPG